MVLPPTLKSSKYGLQDCACRLRPSFCFFDITARWRLCITPCLQNPIYRFSSSKHQINVVFYSLAPDHHLLTTSAVEPADTEPIFLYGWQDFSDKIRTNAVTQRCGCGSTKTSVHKQVLCHIAPSTALGFHSKHGNWDILACMFQITPGGKDTSRARMGGAGLTGAAAMCLICMNVSYITRLPPKADKHNSEQSFWCRRAEKDKRNRTRSFSEAKSKDVHRATMFPACHSMLQEKRGQRERDRRK